MLKIEPVTKFSPSSRPMKYFGPFDTAEAALEWATNDLTREEVLTHYRDEAIEVRDEWAACTDTRHGDYLHGRMLDLVESVDWILFGIVGWNDVHERDGHSVLDPDQLHAPDED